MFFFFFSFSQFLTFTYTWQIECLKRPRNARLLADSMCSVSVGLSVRQVIRDSRTRPLHILIALRHQLYRLVRVQFDTKRPWYFKTNGLVCFIHQRPTSMIKIIMTKYTQCESLAGGLQEDHCRSYQIAIAFFHEAGFGNNGFSRNEGQLRWIYTYELFSNPISERRLPTQTKSTIK